MKTIKKYIILLIGTLTFSACELNDLDNYDPPNSTIYGGIYDIETGELVEQDIINGVQLEYVEQGFSNPEIQYMVVKNDGTYRNNLMFAATYTIRPVRGNFVPVAEQGIHVKGESRVDFRVQPYIRIKNLTIEKVASKIVAKFNIEPTVGNKVRRVSLFAHKEPQVGSPLNTVASEIILNSISYENTEYTLEIDLEENNTKLEAGQQYYFRVGALIDAPEAKFNYAPAIRLTI